MTQIPRKEALTTKLTVAMMTRSGKIQRITDKWKKAGPAPIPIQRQNSRRATQNQVITLEHAVSMTILQTASSGLENAHFVVNHQNRMAGANQTPRSILLDLTQAENLLGTFAANRQSANKISRKGRCSRKNVKKVNPTQNPRPSLKAVQARKYTKEATFRSALSNSRFESTENGPLNDVPDDSFRPNVPMGVPVLPQRVVESFDSVSWGDGESTSSVALTFMTESDAWTSLCSHTYHMGRRKTSIDHDGFPRIAST